jgi:hypothetical protein
VAEVVGESILDLVETILGGKVRSRGLGVRGWQVAKSEGGSWKLDKCDRFLGKMRFRVYPKQPVRRKELVRMRQTG